MNYVNVNDSLGPFEADSSDVSACNDVVCNNSLGSDSARPTVVPSDFEDSRVFNAQLLADRSFFPVDPKEVLKFQVIREKDPKNSGGIPIYRAFLELHNGQFRPVFRATPERRRRPSIYRIEVIFQDSSLDEGAGPIRKVASVRSNYLGTKFVIESGEGELAVVLYEKNPFGLRGPRKMTIIVPPVDISKTKRVSKFRGKKREFYDLYQKNDRNDIIVLHNKTPRWSEEDQMFYLNFQGRVTIASVKNFQIIHKSEADYVLMQFGKIGPNTFSMDVRYPMSCVQAFGIVLSSLDMKVACE